MSRLPAFPESKPTLISPYTQVDSLPRWRRWFGWFCLLSATLLIIAAAILAFTAPAAVSSAPAVPATDEANQPATTPLPPTKLAEEPTAPSARSDLAQPPTLSPGQISALLATPIPALAAQNSLETTGWNVEPFTIIPKRARSDMSSYVAQRGDTIDGIANRFGLQRESIAWCNKPIIAQILRPGDVVNIPPADGACHTVLSTQGKDISDIAQQYGIDDPYAIIDAPANDLQGIPPDTLLPSNKFLFIPGGEGAFITWNAPVQQDSAGNVVAFDPGSAYSCGQRSGGGTFWTNPLPTGTYVRGFYAGHSGIDIAAPTGTPIYAANGGPILYAGRNSWGYGNTVVIAHGQFSTLYGHMNLIAVRCGQSVASGQIIGYVGSTGNSSGPHLHFEIRYRNQPRDPSATLGIGW